MLACFQWFAIAQNSSSSHWGYSYDNTDWSKNFTFSLGLEGLRSNAAYTSTSNTINLKADPKFGFGLMTSIELGVADFVGIALGVHYLHRRFQIAGGSLEWTRTIPTLLLPLEARFYVPRMLSLGAGGFAAFHVGNTKDVFSAGDALFQSTSRSREGVDYGVTGAIGLNLPLNSFGVFAESRYNYGLSNSKTSSDVEKKIRDFMFTVGVKAKI